MRRAPILALLLALTRCGGAARPAPPPTPAPAPEAAPAPVVITVIGTSDTHGHLRALPVLGGHLAGLRRARAAEGGALVLVDAGDMFQGTLESNLEEGASVVRAYAALGYDAVAIGNHEFDFGPVGPNATAKAPGDDPRGALRQRLAEAPFPFLAANLRRKDTGEALPLGVPSALLERAGLKIGVIGVTTEATPFTTIAANIGDLAMAPLAASIADEARALRQRGAAVVVVAAHAGGRCARFDDPADLSSCEDGQEIMAVARALAPGTVDVIVAGHTHQAMAHRVHGVAIVQSYALGVAYGRVDLTVDRRAGRVTAVEIHPPRRLCSAADASPEGPLAACDPRDDQGAPIAPDAAVAAAIAPSLARADALREQPLGPTIAAPFTARRRGENPLGNLFTDLMLAARPGADAAILNGGGLRADLPAGPLRYGSLYEAFPFDNRFARLRMRAGDLAAIVAAGLAGGAFLSLGGLTAEARCEGGAPVVTLRRGKRALDPAAPIEVLASDFLATGGDHMLDALPQRDAVRVTLEDDPPLREAMAEVLRARGPVALAPADYYAPERPRLRFPGALPLRCDPG